LNKILFQDKNQFIFYYKFKDTFPEAQNHVDHALYKFFFKNLIFAREVVFTASLSEKKLLTQKILAYN
jgi:hypothetical protein